MLNITFFFFNCIPMVAAEHDTLFFGITLKIFTCTMSNFTYNMINFVCLDIFDI